MIRIEYSSPGVKGRKIFGFGEDYLVQYNQMWRTGANEATTLATEKDLMIDTLILPKGKYALFTIPGDDTWEMIINQEWNQWGTHNHNDSLDVIRLSITPIKLDSPQEQMTFSLSNDALNFKWENIGWSIPLNSSE